MMKNIQIIDAALNCAYSVYSVSEADFNIVFQNNGQNIEFVEDLVSRIGEKEASRIIKSTWTTEVQKEDVIGIHGTLFVDHLNKKKFYPNKRESDLKDPVIQANALLDGGS